MEERLCASVEGGAFWGCFRGGTPKRNAVIGKTGPCRDGKAGGCAGLLQGVWKASSSTTALYKVKFMGAAAAPVIGRVEVAGSAVNRFTEPSPEGDALFWSKTAGACERRKTVNDREESGY